MLPLDTVSDLKAHLASTPIKNTKMNTNKFCFLLPLPFLAMTAARQKIALEQACMGILGSITPGRSGQKYRTYGQICCHAGSSSMCQR